MAREEQQPMSEARLAEIRERHEGMSAYYAADLDATYPAYPDLPHDYLCDVDELLADNERLRSREAALVVARERVAETGADFDMNTGNSWLLFPGLYAAEQCREQARALLATNVASDTGET